MGTASTGEGLSAGAIVGVLIGVIAAIAIAIAIAALIVVTVRRRKQRSPHLDGEPRTSFKTWQ